MKNLFLLPTDKPSRLFIYDGKLGLAKKSQYGSDVIANQNIYITSDEYVGLSYYLDGNLVRKGVVDDKDYWKVRKDYKKIILTTDQDLIDNGVQAIPDEFLKWFVKNPSCEFVKILKCPIEGKYSMDLRKEKHKQYPIGGYAPGNYYCTCASCKTMFQGDKRAVQCEPCAIETTQEEPKCTCKEHDPYCCQVHGACPTCVKQEEPKQETLEEIEIISKQRIHKYKPMNPHPTSFFIGFKEGAEWQVDNIIKELEMHISINEHDWSRNPQVQLRDFIEQFKKK